MFQAPNKPSCPMGVARCARDLAALVAPRIHAVGEIHAVGNPEVGRSISWLQRQQLAGISRTFPVKVGSQSSTAQTVCFSSGTLLAVRHLQRSQCRSCPRHGGSFLAIFRKRHNSQLHKCQNQDFLQLRIRTWAPQFSETPDICSPSTLTIRTNSV